MSSRPRLAVAIWGVLGVCALLVQAIWRLAPMAWEPIASGELTLGQWLLYLLWVGFNTWAEGVRGFQRRFSPRVVARAFALARAPRPLDATFAPLYAMGLWSAPRRVVISSWALIAIIVALITLIRGLSQPWRGIVDGGVVAGLTWGLGSLLVLLLRAIAGHVPDDRVARA